MNVSLISGFLTKTDSTLKDFVFDGYTALANSLTPVVVTCATLVIVGYGWALMRGIIRTPIIDAANTALKLAVVLVFLKNWSFFSSTLYDFFTNGPISLTRTMIGGTGVDWSLLGSNQVDKALENGLNQGMDKAMQLMGQAGFSSYSPFFAGLFAMLAVLLTCGYALGLLVMAKVGLAICLALAPMFMLCYLFESTKKICEGWMQHVIGFALVPLGVHCVLMLILSLLNHSLATIKMGSQITFATAGVFLLWAIVSIPLLVQTKSLMTSIARGFSFSTMGAFGQSFNHAISMPGKMKSGYQKVRRSV